MKKITFDNLSDSETVEAAINVIQRNLELTIKLRLNQIVELKDHIDAIRLSKSLSDKVEYINRNFNKINDLCVISEASKTNKKKHRH